MVDKTTPCSSTHIGEVPASDEDSYGGSTDEAEQSDSEGIEVYAHAVWPFLLVPVGR